MNKNNNTLIISILIGCFAIALSIIFYAIKTTPTNSNGNIQIETEKQVPLEISIDDDAVLGDPDAPITLVEFSDYNCSYCKRHFTNTFPLIKKKYIDTGKVKMVFRDAAYFGQNSIALANAASCAQKIGGNEAYYKIHTEIFSGNKNLDNIILAGSDFGLDKANFSECIKNNEQMDEVLYDSQDARKYGVNGTPGFFINGVKVSGAVPFDNFEQIIENELSKLN